MQNEIGMTRRRYPELSSYQLVLRMRLRDGAYADLIAWRRSMHGLIYLIGLIVVIMFLLSLLGLR